MTAPARFLTASEAARQLGVSAKALRLYEQGGLLASVRTAAGWRMYGPDQMSRAADIARLRKLGLSLSETKQALAGNARGLGPALTAHQAKLEAELRRLAAIVVKVRTLRGEIARNATPMAARLADPVEPAVEPIVTFDLPWPWGGERFALHHLHPITYVTGPLGSGKTRLAQRLAEALPGAAFLGLERLTDGGAVARGKLAADAALGARVERALAQIREDGASPSDALVALLVNLEAEHPGALVIDMIEQGLDEAAQAAVITHLRRREADARPLLLLTRSCAILNLHTIGAGEAIIYCPANHSPPMRVTPRPGAPGYEAVATCLAPPDVRARTAGMIACRLQVA